MLTQASKPAPQATSDSFLVVGDVRVAEAPVVLSTVLGSCVSVCLWSGERRLGGANHFLLPTSPLGPATDQHGDAATAHLVEAMARAGANPRRLVAKVFGGASLGPTRWNVGAENALAAWRALERARIPVVASDVGGLRGRQLRFHVTSGRVEVHYLGSTEPQEAL